ncbi:putative F420-0 ABC transporter substrate-binding protein [Arenivirga flava]|uniref:putative F420-0 ABC transporter substrate-binding protein n=1 Tax=Arenivirga flava TaxID=1930060 RepID=UPI0024E190A2|nr:putative F420-0 ABC transporter substrate-binding protein [Arenivirga flava]
MPRRPALLLLPAALLLAGCSPAVDAEAPSPSAAAVTVDNCGTEVSLDAPPERIVTVKSTATELVLSLGLGDHLVGTAFADGPLPETLAGFEPPVIAQQLPNQERVLELRPDLVFGGWESNFSADGAGERDELAELGVATYVAPSACLEPGYQPDPLTFELLFDQLLEAGRVLGAEPAAEGLVAGLEERLADVEPLDGGLSVLWWSSGDDTPYVGAGIGAPQMMLDAAGLTNVAADVDATWSPLGWEAIAAADPDVIVLVDASWNTAADKIATLEGDPVLSQLRAVREQRYAIVPFAAGEGGVRNVEAVESIVAQLRAG